jgi:hypothetical protein
MARFKFREGFFLNLGGDILSPTKIRFEAGEQDVPDEYSGHWFLAEMGERIDVASLMEAVPAGADEGGDEPPHVDTAEEVSEKEALRAEAEGLGISVDRRWGIDRLKAEIKAKTPEPVSSPEPEPEEMPAAEPSSNAVDVSEAPVEPEATV